MTKHILCQEEEITCWTTVLLPPRLIRALDRFIAEEAPGLSRPEALRQAFQDWCVSAGYLSLSGNDPDYSC